MLLVFTATLPFLHDFLEPSTSPIFGFKSFRVFIYISSVNIFSVLGWYLFFIHAKGKKYRFAILVPLLIQAYQVIMYIFNLKKTEVNAVEFKFIAVLFAAILFTILFFKGRKILKK